MGQSWFPESWTEIDIKCAGEYVANLPENADLPDGVWVFGEYNEVRTGIIKNNGNIGTIIPDMFLVNLSGRKQGYYHCILWKAIGMKKSQKNRHMR